MGGVWKMHFFLSTSICILPIFILVLVSTQSDNPQELPNEHDNFEDIRAKNKLLIDKSEYIMNLIQSEDRFFGMCRPARFGKSNFLQMLSMFFKGQKERFEGLAIYEKYDWNTSYPVIYLDFCAMDVNDAKNFSTHLNSEITKIGSNYGIQIDQSLPLYPTERQDLNTLPKGDTKLGQLMQHLTQNWKKDKSVIVLIDEYDYPKQRNSPIYHQYIPFTPGDATVEIFLNPFFYELERMKRFIKFLFLTCTAKVVYHYRTKYPDTPISFKDITYDPQFNKMMGLTATELQTNLKQHIDAAITTQPNETFHTLVQKLRKKYNGYCFSLKNSTSESDCRMFNFHSVLSSLRDKDPDYFWNPGGHPRYNVVNNVTIMSEANELFELFSYRSSIITVHRQKLENACGTLPENMADQHTISRKKISIRALLVLYGYLTFRGYNEQSDEFIVDFPNDDMRESYRRTILRLVIGRDISIRDFTEACYNVMKSMLTDKAENFIQILNNIVLKFKDLSADQNFYYRYSGNRVAHVLGACAETALKDAMKPKAFYREFIHRDKTSAENSTNFNDYGYLQKFLCDTLVVRLPMNAMTYSIRIDFERSAACALNEALKLVDTDEFRQASRNNTFHMMGINFNEEDELISDWIRMTYSEGKFRVVEASKPHYLKMYNAYADHLQPFSSFL